MTNPVQRCWGSSQSSPVHSTPCPRIRKPTILIVRFALRAAGLKYKKRVISFPILHVCTPRPLSRRMHGRSTISRNPFHPPRRQRRPAHARASARKEPYNERSVSQRQQQQHQQGTYMFSPTYPLSPFSPLCASTSASCIFVLSTQNAAKRAVVLCPSPQMVCLDAR